MGIGLDLAREMVKRFPNQSSRGLARKLYADNPSAFTTQDAAYSAIRRARGAKGASARKNCPPVQTRSAEVIDAFHRSSGGFPVPEPTDFKIHNLPEGIRRWLILCDVHIPHNDLNALIAVLRWLKETRQKCDGVLILGDFLDCYRLSHFEKDPRKRRFKQEIEDAKQFIQGIRDEIKPSEIVWKEGNHENRLVSYLMAKAEELFDMDAVVNAVSIPNLTGFDGLWIPNHHFLKHRKLTLLHGNELERGLTNPVNPARGAYLRTASTVLLGHHHRTSTHPEMSLDGVLTTCWSVGCLCDLHPRWRPHNKWNHGFATLTTGDDWQIQNPRIIDGKVMQ